MVQHVIPPLLGARGVRCSVKPASRFALLSMSHETRALAQAPCLNSQLGVGTPTWCNHHPSQTQP
ncbi:hypothetical protein Lal_00021126 [Lupinus albus]|nr:hypothetical protein Lal_00021126 [Lupinus albus]